MTTDLLILCATPFESSHFLSLHPCESRRFTRTGLTIMSGKVLCKSYDLLLTGPGVFNAAHALTVYLEMKSPALVLQTGIAGIFRQTGCQIGDLAVATKEQYVHTGVKSDTLENDPLPFALLASDPLTCKGLYPFEKKRVDQAWETLSKDFGEDTKRILKRPFITVSSITSSVERADGLYRVFSPVMEAMEGAASAHVARCYDIPMIEIRSGSNFVGERDKSKWDIDLAVKKLGKACSAICRSGE